MFITFEGIDGSGKSTCIEKLKKYIEQNLDINNFVFTREPGGTNLKECEDIRNILLDKNNDIDPKTEMLLYLASRTLHVNKLIKPSIANNKIVLCDRFFDSSIAYQGAGRNLGLEYVKKMNYDVLDNFKPDFTFYFRIDFQTSVSRMKKNNRVLDRLELEKQDFFKKSIEGYEWLVNQEKERFIIIDATKTPEEVFKNVLNEFLRLLQK